MSILAAREIPWISQQVSKFVSFRLKVTVIVDIWWDYDGNLFTNLKAVVT